MEDPHDGELVWGVAARAIPGEEQCGDGAHAAVTGTGWLLAAADGLGHGQEAAIASTAFMNVVQQHPEKQPAELIRLCHDALRNTRGCAGTIVTIERKRRLLSWAGVGNVEGVLLHAGPASRRADYITLRGGIIGYRLPELQTSSIFLLDGDILILATDGIASDFVHAVALQYSPGELARYILDRYGKATDDALVLTARWRVALPQQGGLSS